MKANVSNLPVCFNRLVTRWPFHPRSTDDVRVVHVLRKYDPSEWGGTETHVVEITRRLALRGFEPLVHAPRGPTAHDEALASNVPLVRYRAFLPFVGTKKARRALVANAGNIASFEEPLRLVCDPKVQLCHLHTTGRIGGAVRTAMRATGRPYVVSIHGPMLANQAWLTDDHKKRSRGTLDVGAPIGALFGSRRVLDDAARVITFNEEERVALSKRIGDRAVRMDHGVDRVRLSSGSVERARSRPNWAAFSREKVVVLIGRMAAQKNQVFAVRAFAAGAPADHHLVLAGAFTDLGYRDLVEKEAELLGIRARVHILGNLRAKDEVPDLLQLASLIIVPSTHEAFGLAVLEGWAAERPVLFARHSGLADLAEAVREEATSLRELDVEVWAEAMKRLLANEAQRRALAKAGLQIVSSRYDWDRVVDRLIALYRDVLVEGIR